MAHPLPEPVITGEIPITPRAAFVYQAYDGTDGLLYIGITENLDQRLAAHRRTSRWFIDARRIAWAQYADRATAERVEYRLIRELYPQYNIAFNDFRRLAATMGHRRLYSTAAWRHLGEVIRDERERKRRPQRAVAHDGMLQITVLRDMEAGASTRYELAELQALEYGMGWQQGSVEKVLMGGSPTYLNADERFLRAGAEADRLDLLGGI